MKIKENLLFIGIAILTFVILIAFKSSDRNSSILVIYISIVTLYMFLNLIVRYLSFTINKYVNVIMAVIIMIAGMGAIDYYSVKKVKELRNINTNSLLNIGNRYNTVLIYDDETMIINDVIYKKMNDGK